MNDKPLLRLLDKAKEERTKEDAKAEAYKKRAKSKSDFYSRARINEKLIPKLIEALQMSAIIDENGEALMPWSDELINEIIDGISDDGPVNKK